MGSPFIRALVITVVIFVLGVLMESYLPVDPPIKRILKVVGSLVILVVWLVWLFGVLNLSI